MAYKIFNQNPWQELVELPDGHSISIPSSGFAIATQEPKKVPDGLMVITVPDKEVILVPKTVPNKNTGKGTSIDVTVSAS